MMTRRKWRWSALLALPLVVASVVYANAQAQSYTCPLTGEEVACKKCCPLDESLPSAASSESRRREMKQFRSHEQPLVAVGHLEVTRAQVRAPFDLA